MGGFQGNYQTRHSQTRHIILETRLCTNHILFQSHYFSCNILKYMSAMKLHGKNCPLPFLIPRSPPLPLLLPPGGGVPNKSSLPKFIHWGYFVLYILCFTYSILFIFKGKWMLVAVEVKLYED